MLNGKVMNANYACERTTFVKPTETHYEDVGEPPYIKYGCPVCELLGNKHQVAIGDRKCPLCNVNLLWEIDSSYFDTNNEERMKMDKQAILDVLNSLEVKDYQGGEDAYILVDNNDVVRNRLAAVGVDAETIRKYGDDESSFCILTMALSEGYCDDYRNGQLVLWGPIDDDLRYRVLNGEGDATDAERLLRALEPGLFRESNLPKCFYVTCVENTHAWTEDKETAWRASEGEEFKVHLHEETKEYFTTDYKNREMLIGAVDVNGLLVIDAHYRLLPVSENKFEYAYSE
jgi:hypothetical protein